MGLEPLVDGHGRLIADLREPLRAGADDDQLEQLIRDAVWRKELKHHIGEPGFIQPARTMSAIGG